MPWRPAERRPRPAIPNRSIRTDPRRRRPVLGIIAVVLLVGAGFALWVRMEDPFNPYRPGTTHVAVLVHEIRTASIDGA